MQLFFTEFLSVREHIWLLRIEIHLVHSVKSDCHWADFHVPHAYWHTTDFHKIRAVTKTDFHENHCVTTDFRKTQTYCHRTDFHKTHAVTTRFSRKSHLMSQPIFTKPTPSQTDFYGTHAYCHRTVFRENHTYCNRTDFREIHVFCRRADFHETHACSTSFPQKTLNT